VHKESNEQSQKNRSLRKVAIFMTPSDKMYNHALQCRGNMFGDAICFMGTGVSSLCILQVTLAWTRKAIK
jgi:hypothetical protein